MEINFSIEASDFSTNAPQILHKVQAGKIAMITDRAFPVATILDIHDYHLLRAAIHHYTSKTREQDNRSTIQELYDRVLSQYLYHEIDIRQASVQLNLPWIDLIQRLTRLDMPVREDAFDLDDAIEELRAIRYLDFPNAWR